MIKQTKDYYIKELVKLLAIIEADKGLGDGIIHRNYVKEKIEMALNGTGINLHPSLDEYVDKFMERFK